jgi:hypothetical protein
MKTITIELDQFRDRLDQALAEVGQGELILTRHGKPWIVMRAVSLDQAGHIVSSLPTRKEGVEHSHDVVDDTLSIVGKTVSWARQYLGGAFKIAPETTIFVDGKRVSDDFVLEQGQILEFSDEGGEEPRGKQLYESPEFWEMIRQRRREESIPWDDAIHRLDLD